ncbi:MAG: DNA-3-methyladenine glycosylase [Tepidisphaeraceae bacterium]
MATIKKRATDWSSAHKHLRRDPVMRKIIAAVGPCDLKPHRDHFVPLCKAIYSQQISSKVAAVLFKRFQQCFPRRRPTPKLVEKLLTAGDSASLKSCGLSRQKREYLIDLSRHFIDNRFPSRRLSRMEDEEIIESLTAIRGIGRWTAEMYLMFVLNRPDVLPVDDFGLQMAVKKAYRLPDKLKAKEFKELGEPWRPHRTVASWYLWRSLDGVKKQNHTSKPQIARMRQAIREANEAEAKGKLVPMAVD